MNDLRRAAQMALEFCENLGENHWGDRKAVVYTLRAALAQPEQLIVGGDDLPMLTKWTPMAEYAAKSAAVPGRAEALKQAGYTRRPQQLPKEDEPVAWNWVLDGKDYGPAYYGKPPDADITKQAEQIGRTVRLLYTAPPQRKPLTEADIKGVLELGLQTWKLSESTVEFARAIERAHGIL